MWRDCRKTGNWVVMQNCPDMVRWRLNFMCQVWIIFKMLFHEVMKPGFWPPFTWFFNSTSLCSVKAFRRQDRGHTATNFQLHTCWVIRLFLSEVSRLVFIPVLLLILWTLEDGIYLRFELCSRTSLKLDDGWESCCEKQGRQLDCVTSCF